MKRITPFMIILIFSLLTGLGIFWYVTKPIAITGHILPSGSEPSPAAFPTTIPQQVTPAPSSATIDTRSWGERFRDPAIPQVPGVAWQTYTNKEYGFQMEYPKGWGIRESKNNLTKGIDFNFYQLSHPQEPLFGLSIFRGKLMDELMRRDAGWVERIQKYDLVPDAKINDVSLYIQNQNANSHESLLSAFLEKNANTYEFGESIFVAYDDIDKSIIEHTIKTFRFLK